MKRELGIDEKILNREIGAKIQSQRMSGKKPDADEKILSRKADGKSWASKKILGWKILVKNSKLKSWCEKFWPENGKF